MPSMQARCVRFEILLTFLRRQLVLNDFLTAGASQVAITVGENTTKLLQVEDNGMGIQVECKQLNAQAADANGRCCTELMCIVVTLSAGLRPAASMCTACHVQAALL